MPKELEIMKMGSHLDIEIDENDPYGRGDGYYIYRDYGSDKEFLYARAIQEITGQAPAPTTRSAEPLMRGKALRSLPSTDEDMKA